MRRSGEGRAGNRASFEETVVPERDRLFAYLLGMVGDREAALDLVQETYLAAWDSFARFRGESRPLTWLVGIARRIAMRRIRRQAHRDQLLDSAIAMGDAEAIAPAPAESPEAGVLKKERENRIRAAVLTLPPTRREVVVLHYFVGLTVAEVARITNENDGTVKSRLARARHALLGLLDADLES